jgi:hypothetical protein
LESRSELIEARSLLSRSPRTWLFRFMVVGLAGMAGLIIGPTLDTVARFAGWAVFFIVMRSLAPTFAATNPAVRVSARGGKRLYAIAATAFSSVLLAPLLLAGWQLAYAITAMIAIVPAWFAIYFLRET